MELKPYQQKVIRDLEQYLEYLQQYKLADKAFNEMYKNLYGDNCFLKGISPYQKSIPNAAYVCIKVPTAGGKTFIACNAIRSIFSIYDNSLPKAVVWLVPWSNLLEQTKNALSNPEHEYRKKLNSLFNYRIETYTKDTLLQGANFNVSTIYEQLNIFILNFASLRIKNKEDRKIFQDNGNLAGFKDIYENKNHYLQGADENSLINVIRYLNPIVIVDESHNAESELSVDMLKNLNPSFILELTATPQKTSNIISFTNAQKLKEENMVKLPVIVYNHKDKNEVISSALQLRQELQILADREFEKTGKYIRPIVLFQAQPKGKEDNTTFQKLKQHLIELSIPEEEVKIKTATINEIDEDLMSPDCKVKYIITINALKEGWDCPFAYILATLADKSSTTDVTQILGRILRQPYVIKHQSDFLNNSYVITASDKFNETLKSIVKGLNEAGFSDLDYVAEDFTTAENQKLKLTAPVVNQPEINFPNNENNKTETQNTTEEINTQIINYNNNDNTKNEAAKVMLETAKQLNEEYKNNLEETQTENKIDLPAEMKKIIKPIEIKEVFKKIAEKIEIPQFFLKIEGAENSDLVSDTEFFNKEELLKGFELSKADINIDYADVNTELYKADLEETKKDTYIAAISKLQNSRVKEQLIEYIVSKPKETQVRQLAGRMMNMFGNMYPIADQEIIKYIERILESFNKEQIVDFSYRDIFYRDKIKAKIKKLADEFAEKQFVKYLDIDKIIIKPNFKFNKNIIPKNTSTSISKSLYEKEGLMNNFEQDIIMKISNLETVAFWHRNIEKSGFCINGFKSNHYPDFIVQMKNGKTIIIETKGDHLDGSDSKQKLELGQTWANKCGSKFRYFMVFETKKLEGAKTVSELIDILKELK